MPHKIARLKIAIVRFVGETSELQQQLSAYKFDRSPQALVAAPGQFGASPVEYSES